MVLSCRTRTRLDLRCCIAGASVMSARPSHFTVGSRAAQLPAGLTSVGGLGGVYSLIVTGLVTGCTESTGFIHDVSLRWNLFRERRLRWITNLRLLSTSRVTPATCSPTNLLYFLTLAIAYTASSQIFIPTAFSSAPYIISQSSSGWDETGDLASGAAVMTLGTQLVVQAALITWIYFASRRHIKTWSSNPLRITLACVSSEARLA